MLTVKNLKEFGADTDEGITRCLNDEDFYLDLVRSVIPDERLDELEKLIADRDFDKAFEMAHALKGMYGNISLKPIYEPICEITELLRDKKDGDYSRYLTEAKEQKKKLVEIVNSRK